MTSIARGSIAWLTYMGARIRVVRGAWAGAPVVIGGALVVDAHRGWGG